MKVNFFALLIVGALSLGVCLESYADNSTVLSGSSSNGSVEKISSTNENSTIKVTETKVEKSLNATEDKTSVVKAEKSLNGYKEQGTASWYGEKFHGKVTATGEPYDMSKPTAAHNYLPLGTKIKVTNLANKKVAILTVNDRGPFVPDRILDVSKAGAKELGFLENGTAQVVIEIYVPEKELKAAPIVPAKAKLYGAFYIQVGAFGVKENADKLLKKVEELGYKNVRMLKITTDESEIYKVQIGMYKTLAKARVIHQDIQKSFSGTFVLADVIQK